MATISKKEVHKFLDKHPDIGYKQNSTNGRVCQSGRDDNGNIES